ncbi:MAG: hypothetical protein ACKPKO_01475 [Candidatus Fonsibacter sp.]
MVHIDLQPIYQNENPFRTAHAGLACVGGYFRDFHAIKFLLYAAGLYGRGFRFLCQAAGLYGRGFL